MSHRQQGSLALLDCINQQTFHDLRHKCNNTVCYTLLKRLSTTPPSLLTLRLIDALSSSLCQLIDSAELTRNVHTQRDWREAAEHCIIAMQAFMEELNTNQMILNKLIELCDSINVMNSLTAEQQRVAQLLLSDLILHGAKLPPTQQRHAAQLQSNIIQMQQTYSNNINQLSSHSAASVKIDAAAATCRRLPAGVRRKMRFHSDSSVTVSLDNESVDAVLRWCPSERIRRLVFTHASQSMADNAQLMGTILQTRQQLAQLFGFESFAQMTTSTLLAKNSETVQQFLFQLIESLRPRAQQELEELELLKAADADIETTRIQHWDTQFYMSQVKSTLNSID